MARRQARPRPEQERTLVGTRRECPACGKPMRIRYENRRTVVTLNGPMRLRLKIRRCESPTCMHRHRAHRPEAEGAIALPQHEFGLDVIALVGTLRHREHRSVPEIHRALRERGVVICERSVTNLLERYEELLAVSLSDDQRLRTVLAGQGRVLLALAGLQPDVGHEVLWVLRDCLSGEVLLARSLLSLCCFARWPTRSACRSRPCSAMANARSVRLWRGPCRAYRTSCATSTICARRRCRSMRPTATPKRNSRSECAAFARSSAAWRAARIARRSWSAVTARRCAAPSRMMAARLWPPRA